MPFIDCMQLQVASELFRFYAVFIQFMQSLCRAYAIYADFVQYLCRFYAHYAGACTFKFCAPLCSFTSRCIQFSCSLSFMQKFMQNLMQFLMHRTKTGTNQAKPTWTCFKFKLPPGPCNYRTSLSNYNAAGPAQRRLYNMLYTMLYTHVTGYITCYILPCYITCYLAWLYNMVILRCYITVCVNMFVI